MSHLRVGSGCKGRCAPLAGGLEYRGDQCALQLADRSGSARDHRRWTAGASLLRGRMRSPRPMRWCSWWSRLCPANGCSTGICPIGAHRAAVQRRYAQGGMAALDREEGWRRGRRRISGKRLRSIEMLKGQGMSNRLGVSGQAGRTFEAGRERAACARRDHDRSGEAAGNSRAVCNVDRQ